MDSAGGAALPRREWQNIAGLQHWEAATLQQRLVLWLRAKRVPLWLDREEHHVHIPDETRLFEPFIGGV